MMVVGEKNKINSIMLVDDDATTNFINEMLITGMDIPIQLTITHNGQEAIDTIRRQCIKKEQCPDLILLDINMPVMNGFEFLEAFEKLNYEYKKSTVIIMLTTSLNPKDIKRIKDFNVPGFISKPLVEKELKEILTKHFDI